MIKNYSVSKLENRKALLVYPEFPIDSFWNYRLLYEKIFPKTNTVSPKADFPRSDCYVSPMSLAQRMGARMSD